jgi:hypothetical protein
MKTQGTKIHPVRQALGGMVLLAMSIAIIAISWRYPTGGIVEMGPGYMPKLVGAMLAVLAVLIIVADLRDPRPAGQTPVHWRSLVFLAASVLAFGFLVNRLGLVPATFLSLVLAMLADGAARPLGIIVYATVVTALSWVLFVPLLGLPLSAFWR